MSFSPEKREYAYVPAQRRAAEEHQVLHAELPTTNRTFNRDAAIEAILDDTRWGESGKEFLLAVFFDADRKPQKVTFEEVVDHCVQKTGIERARAYQNVIATMERFEQCGLVLLEHRGGMFSDHYYVNPTPRALEALGLKTAADTKVFETRSENFNPAEAHALLAEHWFAPPFKPDLSAHALLARLAEPKQVSDLLKDETLYVDDCAKIDIRTRGQLEYFLNAALKCGAIQWQMVEQRGEQKALYGLTAEGRQLLHGESTAA